jgi:hypothetical protein
MLVAAILAVGVIGALIALHGREGNPQFVAQQQGIQPVTAASLQELVLTTHDPRPGRSGRARNASCSAGSRGGLGDPWTCVVRYPQLPRIRFHVTVNANRSIDGFGQPEGTRPGTPLTVSGCCVQTP